MAIVYLKRLLCFITIFCLVFEQAGFAQVAPQFVLPAYLQNLAPVSDHFRPVHLRSVSIDAGTHQYSLLLDKGDAGLAGPQDADDAARKLMSYVEIGLRLPNSMFWVNLRPDSPENIIDPNLARTDVGKILLEADLQLKKDLARLTSPDTQEGRRYWDTLYRKAESVFGAADVEIPTLTRPWIVPGEIIVADAPDGMYIYKATLNVMLEQDHLKDSAFYDFSDPRMREMNAFSSDLIRTMILPKLTGEVNASKRYAGLRQVYYSLILAQLLKQKNGFASGPAGAQIDTRDLKGFVSSQPWSAGTYYAAYRRSFSEGEYDREDTVEGPKGISIRRYFSGGAALQGLGNAVMVVKTDGGDIDAFTRGMGNNLYKASYAQPAADYSLAEEQKTRDDAIRDLRGLIAAKQDMARKFENDQRNNRVAPVVPFDMRNPDHARLLKQYIRAAYCKAENRSAKIKEFSKRKQLNAAWALTTQVFDFVASYDSWKPGRSAMKLDKAVLSIIYTHDYGKGPLTRSILQQELQKKGTARLAYMRMYCRVLEYLGIAGIGKISGPESIVLRNINMPILKAWFPDIESYAAIRFNEIENVSGALDGGQRGLSYYEALFNDLWRHFVATDGRSYYPQLKPGTAASEIDIPYDPEYIGQFREYIISQMLDQDGEFNTEWAKRLTKQNNAIVADNERNGRGDKLRGIFTRDAVNFTKRMLFPNGNDYVQKRAVWIMYAHNYAKNGPLTLADIEGKIKKPVEADSGDKGLIPTVQQTIRPEFLALMGLIDKEESRNVITGVHRDRFRTVYPDIAQYGKVAFTPKEVIRDAIKDIIVREWFSRTAGDRDIKDVIKNAVNADSVNTALGRPYNNRVSNNTINTSKNILLNTWDEKDILAWWEKRHRGQIPVAQRAEVRDGGSHAEIFIDRLWTKFVSSNEQRQSYGPAPVADAEVMREFRRAIQASMAKCGKKTEYFKALKMNINMSVAYSLYKLLFAARGGDGESRSGIRALIASHDYASDGPLTVAALHGSTRVGKTEIRNYLRALDELHAINLADMGEGHGSLLDSSIVSVNPEILAVWVSDDPADGGADESAAEVNNAQSRIVQLFIKRAAKDNDIKIEEFDPRHDPEHAQKLKDYLNKRFTRENPLREKILGDFKKDMHDLRVSPVQFGQVSDFLLSQRNKKGVVILDKPALWAIFSHPYSQQGTLTCDKINKLIKRQGILQEQKYHFYITVLKNVGIIVETEKNGATGRSAVKKINRGLMKRWFPDIMDYESHAVRPAGAYKKAFARLLAAEMRKNPANSILPEQTGAAVEAIDSIRHYEVTDGSEIASARTVTDYKKEFRKAAYAGQLRSLLEENGIVFEQGPGIVQARVPESRPVEVVDGGVKPGGVDLRDLAAKQCPSGVPDAIPAGRDGSIPEEALLPEWRPYVSQCKTADGTVSVRQVRAYLATILRAEEEYGMNTAPQIKAILSFIR
jgi:hypothetical protein